MATICVQLFFDAPQERLEVDLLIAQYGDGSLDRCLHDYWMGVRNG